MNRFRLIFGLVFIATLIYSCAQIGRPQGGPKDVTPPEFVSSSPQNYSTYFDQEEIRIQFNEFIRLQNAQQQIIFSPPILPRPEITPMGTASKEIRIKLPIDSLQDNTTYTINFGQSIEDNNEGNPLPFFKYVFSTGDYIDSLKLDGFVNDMNFRETPEFVSVLLYEKDSTYSDSVVFKKLPTYVTFSKDSTNVFSLENMREGTYKLVALEDKNRDYKFNPGREKIGFIDSFITLPTTKNYKINLFNTYKDFKPIRPKQVSKNHLIFGYQGVLDTMDYNIELLTKAPDTFQTRITKSRESDTLNYWMKPYFQRDSLLFAFKHQSQVDTLVVKTKDMEADSLQIETKPKSMIKFDERVFIKANLPIEYIDTSKIDLIDTDSLKIKFKFRVDSFQNQVEMAFDKVENSKYQMSILPGAVKDFYGNTNDTIKLNLKTKPLSDYSVLVLTITNLDRYPAIVQLVDDKEKVEKSVILTNTNTHTFEHVNPGKYYIKVIYDDNNNGVWDSGDYLENIQPEAVKYSPTLLELRANWDVVQRVSLP
ncbi:Ig-like domain-containing protein [Psychroflexus sp. MBR-150]